MGVGGGLALPNGRETRHGGVPGPETARADLSRLEAAEYIAGLLDGLKAVAHTAGLTFLTYLLTMALEEAQAEKTREDGPG